MTESLRFPFWATCPTCKDVRAQVRHGYPTLMRLIDSNCVIEANCNICGGIWSISDRDRARLEMALAIFR